MSFFGSLQSNKEHASLSASSSCLRSTIQNRQRFGIVHSFLLSNLSFLFSIIFILTVTGRASVSDISNTNLVVVSASDSYDFKTDNLTIHVQENKPPEKPLIFTSAIEIFEDRSETHTVEQFTDSEADPITYDMKFADSTTLDSTWISFDPTTRVLSYTPKNSVSSPISLKIIVTDPHNDPVEESITLTLRYKPKNNPLIVERTGEFVCLSISTFVFSKNIITDDANIVSYSYSLSNGSAVPSWLEIKSPLETSSQNFEVNGTYPIFQNNQFDFTITATDQHGLTGSANFTIITKLY